MERALREQIVLISKQSDSIEVVEKKIKEGDKKFDTHMEEI